MRLILHPISLVPRFVMIALLAGATSTPGLAQGLRDALAAFDGEWRGEMEVRAIDGYLLKTLPIVRRYYWEGDEQFVETQFTDDGRAYTMLDRQTIQLGRLRAIAQREGQPDEVFLGTYAEGTIRWTNNEHKSRDRSETLTAENGTHFLAITSTEVLQLESVTGLVRLVFSLRSENQTSVQLPTTDAVEVTRIAELEAALADGEAASSRLQTALDSRLEQIKILEEEKAALEARVDSMEAAAAASAAVEDAETEKQIAALRLELASARENAEAAVSRAEKLNTDSESLAARLAEAEQSAELNSQQASAVVELRTTLEQQAAEMKTLREQLDQALADAAGLVKQTGAARAERDSLATQVAEINGEAELAAAELLAASSLAEELRADLDAQQSLAGQLQADNERLVARIEQLETERDVLSGRVENLEQERDKQNVTMAATVAAVASPTKAEEGPETRFVQSEALMREIDKLDSRIIRIESERNNALDRLAIAQAQLNEMRELRDDTLARFQDVVSQLNTVRGERDRLVRANVSLESEIRALRPEREESSSPSSELYAGADAADDSIESTIAAYHVVGVTKTDGEEKVILDGRLFRKGDIVNIALGITFARIDADALVFTDRGGREYRRGF